MIEPLQPLPSLPAQLGRALGSRYLERDHLRDLMCILTLYQECQRSFWTSTGPAIERRGAPAGFHTVSYLDEGCNFTEPVISGEAIPNRRPDGRDG